jgi:ABC-2 type transport system permease protein
MQTTIAILKRELRSYFSSPIAYVFMIFLLSFTNVMFFMWFFEQGRADLNSFFFWMQWAFAFCIPAITMRLIAEEKKLGTFELLFTLPVNSSHAVLGKFIATVAILVLILFLTLPVPITVAAFTAKGSSVDWAVVVGNYLGALLLGTMMISIGIFASCMVREQVVAFLFGLVICFAGIIIGFPFVTSKLPPWLAGIVQPFTLSYHFESIRRGVIDFSDLLYFVSGTFLFLFLSTRILDERKF